MELRKSEGEWRNGDEMKREGKISALLVAVRNPSSQKPPEGRIR
jgi:hypothetical protein